MKKINNVKNIAIILDFVVSIIASSLQQSNPKLSSSLFGVSAIILIVAVICVVVEVVKSSKK